MKVEEIRSKTDQELEFDSEVLKKELFELRFKAATDSAANPARIRVLRRSIARINTIQNERSTGIRDQEPK
ncbi:MAG: 50S ribosomal protein L29 [Planctomycetota bacterium]|jgi:large subunit ribosomal protein L29|nr:50S ribosomal protein L29 [Planctomycetota bacterium]MDP6368571.1 50S ribosomal protein L29 [Planctomycetota bacterium]MDP6520891.1 50S ribosomal protein L29 [Planctomycetota bacterium]MDP6839049.1 50S ribosomal protein L29 [Planctomycetota bacterium]MDP6957156.1 50S ribosomal protein L29 [Planctomycetota bacterium]